MGSVRRGIVGVRNIADTVAGDFALVSQAELIVVVSRDLERSRRLARKHGIPVIHRDYRVLIESDGVDVVHIVATHPHHHDIALAAISAGKVVLVKEAFIVTLAGTEEVVAAAAEAGVFAMKAMWIRFLLAVETAREVMAWGRIGQVLGVQGSLCALRPHGPMNWPWDPATGGGAVLDLGVYVVSMAQRLLGAVRDVHCVGRYAPNGVESVATMSISYIGGDIATLTYGFDVHGPGRMATFGTRGWVEIQPRLHHPATISVHRLGVLPRIIEVKQIGRGYARELMGVSDCLFAGQIQLATILLADTVEVMRVLESYLKQLGRSQKEAKVEI